MAKIQVLGGEGAEGLISYTLLAQGQPKSGEHVINIHGLLTCRPIATVIFVS
jgi:hypothetical protein